MLPGSLKIGLDQTVSYCKLRQKCIMRHFTTDMALRIGKFAGNGPGLWLRMQQAYDLWYAEHRMKDELSKIETVTSTGSSAQHRESDAWINHTEYWSAGVLILKPQTNLNS